MYRICKICKIEKEHSYLSLNAQGRAVYKSEDGRLWHGRSCPDCWVKQVFNKSDKTHLKEAHCNACGIKFQQKSIRQRYCSRKCQRKIRL